MRAVLRNNLRIEMVASAPVAAILLSVARIHSESWMNRPARPRGDAPLSPARTRHDFPRRGPSPAAPASRPQGQYALPDIYLIRPVVHRPQKRASVNPTTDRLRQAQCRLRIENARGVSAVDSARFAGMNNNARAWPVADWRLPGSEPGEADLPSGWSGNDNCNRKLPLHASIAPFLRARQNACRRRAVR